MFGFIAAGSGGAPIDLSLAHRDGEPSAAQPGSMATRRITVEARDITCGEHVRELFEHCGRLFREGGTHIVIDLQSVTRADTKIVACLVALYQIARSVSATLEVRLSQAVVEIASVCRLDALVRELAQQPTGDGTRGSRSA